MSPWSSTLASTSSSTGARSPRRRPPRPRPPPTSAAPRRTALPPPQGVRRDRGLRRGVLGPVEEHLARPQRLGHLPDHEVAVLAGQLLRDLLGEVADLVGVLVARAARRRGAAPCCRSSPAPQPRPRSSSFSRTSSATRQHSCRPAPGPGSRSIDQPVGVLRLVVAPRTSTGARAARATRGWPGRSAPRVSSMTG